MLDLLLIVLCLIMIVGFSRHWIRLTRELQEERRQERLKSHLNWKRGQPVTVYGSTVRGSALNRAG